MTVVASVAGENIVRARAGKCNTSRARSLRVPAEEDPHRIGVTVCQSCQISKAIAIEISTGQRRRPGYHWKSDSILKRSVSFAEQHVHHRAIAADSRQVRIAIPVEVAHSERTRRIRECQSRLRQKSSRLHCRSGC
jgi:hypothetical protein